MPFLSVLLKIILVLARLLPFLIVAVIVFLLWRRSARKSKDPDFEGPVYTVDYRVVDDDEEENTK